MPVSESRPFMGKLELDPDDPDFEGKIGALREQATQFGSNVVSLMYPGLNTQIYYGTNHSYQYSSEERTNPLSV